ncbi:MAG: YeeE/YedE family protein [Gemmatimonadetes bacterium]|jgi:uncharacterized protein|nr:YeeE/YedE family protein [Gemmatimonadota bacterium]MBT6144765.1 YeeE/YedE family protein [Gemmatimonadota bacterium]MBT7863444.1 YeeE/YedE family protein [Gemmatimonadota bacterium]
MNPLETVTQPWPWYIGGALIGLTVPLLLLLLGKPFGVSSSFRHLCTVCLPTSRLAYLRNNDWRKESWSLYFIVGITIGAWVASHYLSAIPVVLLPDHYVGTSGALRLLIGGVLVGFGTRYADGCTSGHSIMGLSRLRWPSLVATISFFAGGLLMVHVLFPLWS